MNSSMLEYENIDHMTHVNIAEVQPTLKVQTVSTAVHLPVVPQPTARAPSLSIEFEESEKSSPSPLLSSTSGNSQGNCSPTISSTSSQPPIYTVNESSEGSGGVTISSNLASHGAINILRPAQHRQFTQTSQVSSQRLVPQTTRPTLARVQQPQVVSTNTSQQATPPTTFNVSTSFRGKPATI